MTPRLANQPLLGILGCTVIGGTVMPEKNPGQTAEVRRAFPQCGLEGIEGRIGVTVEGSTTSCHPFRSTGRLRGKEHVPCLPSSWLFILGGIKVSVLLSDFISNN